MTITGRAHLPKRKGDTMEKRTEQMYLLEDGLLKLRSVAATLRLLISSEQEDYLKPEEYDGLQQVITDTCNEIEKMFWPGNKRK